MDTLDHHLREYQEQLTKGHIQKAYRGIMSFMSGLKACLEKKYPHFSVSALYFGYMDMTYFAFTPPQLKDKKLKIAIVYLHEEGRFEAWIGGSNRKIQDEYIEQLKHQDIGKYQLSQVSPGVDSIIETVLVAQPDFANLEALELQIEEKTNEFIRDMLVLMG